MFVLSALFYFYEFILQVSPSIMTDNLIRSLNIKSTTVGWIAGVYFYAYTLMQVPAGLLYDRFGAKRIIVSALLFCSTGAILFSTSQHVAFLIGSRFLMGIGSACAYLGVLEICVRWIPPCYFAIFAGIAQGLGSLGAATGQAPLAALVNHLGWRHSMLTLGLVGIGLIILIVGLLRDGPKGSAQLKAAHESMHETNWHKLHAVLSKPQNWFVALFALSIWTPVPIFASLWGVPFLMEKYHISNVTAGAEVSLIWFGIAIGGPLAGLLAFLTHRRRMVLAAFSIIGFCSALMVIFADHVSIGLEEVFLVLMGLASGSQALTFGFVRLNNHPSIASAANGFNNMAIVLGGAIFQPIVGAILDYFWHGQMAHGVRFYNLHSFQVSLMTVPAFFCLSFLVVSFLIKKPENNPA